MQKVYTLIIYNWKTKLQKQVDFLDTHLDYGFVGAYNNLLYDNGELKYDKYEYLPAPQIEGCWELYGDVFEFAKYGPVTRTVSLCFRSSIVKPYLQYVGLGNDLVLQNVLAKFSLFAKCSDVMCVYRQGGVSTSKYILEKQLYYNDWYVSNRLLQKQIFPADCDWNEDELLDRRTYILLQYAIRRLNFSNVKKYRNKIKSQNYKKKIAYKYSSNIFLILMLYTYSLIKRTL